MLGVDRRLVRRVGALHGVHRQIDELYEQLDGLGSVWRDQMPDAIAKAKETLGADELLVAVQAGAVKVGSLGDAPNADVIADSLRRAAGASTGSSVDDMIVAFTARIVEMLADQRSFPLFDAQSSGLIRALEREAAVTPSPRAMQRGAEVSSAASFMGYLPYFPDLPMDEVLDLRKALERPLARFRGALARMSREFESRPIDDEFDAEVEDAWRAQVAPALADIREALSEHWSTQRGGVDRSRRSSSPAPRGRGRAGRRARRRRIALRTRDRRDRRWPTAGRRRRPSSAARPGGQTRCQKERVLLPPPARRGNEESDMTRRRRHHRGATPGLR
jgi:hypothetical protein